MINPFIDPALIVAALSAGETAALADVIVEIGGIDAATERRATHGRCAILIAALETDTRGPEGLGNGRHLSETIRVVIQLRNAAQDDGAAARPSLRAIRAAIFADLEGARLDAAWAPLRYLGGYMPEELILDRYYYWIERYQSETPAPVRPRT